MPKHNRTSCSRLQPPKKVSNDRKAHISYEQNFVIIDGKLNFIGKDETK